MQLVNDRLYEVWQKRWEESEKGRVTHSFIKDVRFAEECKNFELKLHAGFLMTGHGSLNEFLLKRRLAETGEYACGAASEDWKHVMVECLIYDDVRSLDECGVRVLEDGSVDVSGVLENKDRYESFCKFAGCVFERRKRVRNVQ